MKQAYIITIQGLVQGVGFRPFIYGLAKQYQVKGWVKNTNENVIILAECTPEVFHNFIESIKKEAPVIAVIDSIEYRQTDGEGCSDFIIVHSENLSGAITLVSPDIAVCDDCLRDFKMQDFRINYPFVNCTNCGPRFTIIRDLPYDRQNTTMDVFQMCENCAREYNDINDRRFHAQPVACDQCGPEYELVIHGKGYGQSLDKMLDKVKNLLDTGKVIAIKGMGGYHMMCNALNEDAVKRLRASKRREGKPFAVLFRDITSLKKYAHLNTKEEEAIQSWKRPIVILDYKKPLAYAVSNGFGTVGAMLPYLPFHYALFEKINQDAVVLTSGNISDEPIVIDNQDAITTLGSISDALIIYNRDIYNRVDDSVLFITHSKERLIRRSRGFVPSPVRLSLNVEGIFAAGAELVNTFAIGKGNQAILSQYIGDLKNYETYEFYKETVMQFRKLFRFNPSLVVSDLHPDYLSTRYAEEVNAQQIKVQHHHAHAASCMVEHGLDEKVIAVSMDGTGLGDDNRIWGGEFLVCDLTEYERCLHFDYIPIPGGDKAVEEPWRTGMTYLYKYLGKDFARLNIPFIQDHSQQEIDWLIQAIDKEINAPLTSSAGRLFDAVAAITGICTHSLFHAEAPMRLEDIINKRITKKYSYKIKDTISFGQTILQITEDIRHHVPVSDISTKFHNTIVSVILEATQKIRDLHQVNKVVLSGGTFQNRYLLEKTELLLSENHFEVFAHSKVPSNDGGIALGQLAIAAKRRI